MIILSELPFPVPFPPETSEVSPNLAVINLTFCLTMAGAGHAWTQLTQAFLRGAPSLGLALLGRDVLLLH